MQPPSTVLQVVLLVILVLPGITYQYLRERWRGPVAAERQFGERVMRAIVASIALDAVYVLLIGPHLVKSWMAVRRPDTPEFSQHLRAAAGWAVVLFLVVPALSAMAVSWWQRRRATATYRPAPTAWDYLFSSREHGRPCFIRARLKDGSWVGGWYGSRSYAASYPDNSDLFLQAGYEMSADGTFGPPVQGTSGLYLRVENIDVLELVEPPPAPGARHERDTAPDD